MSPRRRQPFRPSISIRYVVDSTVMQAAGPLRGPSQALTARACRDFLMVIYTVCHRAVINNAIENEWRCHASTFSRMWWTRMARSGKCAWVGDCERDDVRRRIDSCSLGATEVQAMRDDIHLVEAALATDRRIVSMDAEALRLFSLLAEEDDQLRSLQWIDPQSGERPPARH